VGRIRSRSIRLAVVANRVRSSAQVYRPLERFLGSLSLPFLTRLTDSEVYLRAAETGFGVFEVNDAAPEREEFMPIIEWIGGQRAPEAAPERKVIDLAQSRWTDRISVPFGHQGLSTVGGPS